MTENEISHPVTDLKVPEMEQGSSSATENQETYDGNVAKLDKLMAEGHKLMLAQSFNESSVVLCEAVELTSKFFGDFAPQSFFPHFNYGKALIEIARLESLPIKPPLENIDESDDEDEPEEPQNKNGTTKEDNDCPEKNDNQKEEEKENTEEESDEKGMEQSADEGNEQQSKTEQFATERDVTLDGEEAEEDGDEEDIQIAWENLEVARKICENQMKGDQLKLWMERKADVLIALGDCMTVAENFPCALEEFTKALDIRKELYGETDRRIAEVFFWIGRTHKLMDDFKTAAEHFGNSKKVLEKVIAAKETALMEKGEERSASLSQELEELKEAVKELEENIQDAVDSIEQQKKRDEAMKAILQPFMQALSDTGNEANDITGMLKRKAMKRPVEVYETNGSDCDKNGQQSAKMSKMEKDNENGGERQTTDSEKNGKAYNESGGERQTTDSEQNGKANNDSGGERQTTDSEKNGG